MLGRSLRWIREQLAFLIVAAGLVAAFLYLLVEPGHWRRGTAAISAAILVAAVLRLVLRDTASGMLAVRGRWVDTFFYVLLGGLILAVDIRLHS